MSGTYHYTFRSEQAAHNYGRQRLKGRYEVQSVTYLVPSDAPESDWCTRREFDVIAHDKEADR